MCPLKPWIRNTIIAVAAAVVLLSVSPTVLVSLFEKTIREKIEVMLDRQLKATVAFEDLSINTIRHFPNVSVDLHHLVINGTGAFAGDTLAKVDELRLELRTVELLLGETELKSLHLYHPVARLWVDRIGNSNFDILEHDSVRKEKGKDGIHLALDAIQVTDGSVSYLNEQSHWEATLKGINHEGRGDFQKDIFDFSTITSAEDVSLRSGKTHYLRNKRLSIDLGMELNLAEGKYTILHNTFKINEFGIQMEGALAKDSTGLAIDLRYQTTETTFKNLLSLIPGVLTRDLRGVTTKGDLIFAGYVKGLLDPSTRKWPSTLTKVEVSDGWLKVDSLPDPIENIRLQLEIRNEKGIPDSTVYDLKTFTLDLKKHPVSGRVRVIGAGHSVDADIQASADLADIERIYPLSRLQLAGLADFSLRMQGGFRSDGDSLVSVPTFSVNLKLSDGKLQYAGLPAALDKVSLHLVAGNPDGNPAHTSWDVRGIHADLGESAIHGFFRMTGYRKYKITSDLKVDVDLADMEKVFPMDSLVFKGSLKADIKADGEYHAKARKFPMLDAVVELKDGYLKTAAYPRPLENIHLWGEFTNTTGAFKDTRLNIQRLTYSLDDEPFEVRGSVADLDNYEYDLQVKGLVNLTKLAKVYSMPGIQLEGIIISDVETRGRLTDLEAGRYERTWSKGSVQIKDLLVTGPGVRKRLAVTEALLTLTPGKVILEKLSGKFGSSTLTMTGDLYNYMAFVTRTDDAIKCDLKVKCDTLKMEEWVQFDPDTVATRKATADSVALNRIWKVPENLDVVFDSEIGHLLYDDMKITNLVGEITMHQGVMTMHETGFNTLNARFDISGDYDTRDMAHPTFDVDVNIHDLDINKAYRELHIVRTLASSAADTYGTFSLDYKLKGELKPDFTARTETLVGQGEIRVKDAKVNGMKIFEELSKASKKGEVNDPHLYDFVVKSEVRDNKIIVRPFAIRVSGMDADIEGVSEINGTLRYLVKLQVLHLKIPFHVTGTYDNPKVTIGKGHVLDPSDSLR